MTGCGVSRSPMPTGTSLPSFGSATRLRLRGGPVSHRVSRRDFLGLGAAGAIGLARPLCQNAQAGEPDLIVFNAKVYTMDARVPRAEAFAVAGGKCVAMGRSSDIRAL